MQFWRQFLGKFSNILRSNAAAYTRIQSSFLTQTLIFSLLLFLSSVFLYLSLPSFLSLSFLSNPFSISIFLFLFLSLSYLDLTLSISSSLQLFLHLSIPFSISITTSPYLSLSFYLSISSLLYISLHLYIPFFYLSTCSFMCSLFLCSMDLSLGQGPSVQLRAYFIANFSQRFLCAGNEIGGQAPNPLCNTVNIAGKALL